MTKDYAERVRQYRRHLHPSMRIAFLIFAIALMAAPVHADSRTECHKLGVETVCTTITDPPPLQRDAQGNALPLGGQTRTTTTCWKVGASTQCKTESR